MMKHRTHTGRYSAALAALLLCSVAFTLFAQDRASRGGGTGPAANLSLILGRPTDRSITLSILSAGEIEARVEYGAKPGTYAERTEPRTAKAGVLSEFETGPLKPNTRYYYRLPARQVLPLWGLVTWNSEKIGWAPIFFTRNFCSWANWRRRATCHASSDISSGLRRRAIRFGSATMLHFCHTVPENAKNAKSIVSGRPWFLNFSRRCQTGGEAA